MPPSPDMDAIIPDAPEPQPTSTAPAPDKRGGSFAGDVLKLVSGTTIAQVIGILIVPILARIFSPSDYGINALFNSLLGVVTVIACLRYEMTIVIARDDGDAANMLAVSVFFSLITSLLTVPIVLLWSKPISALFGSPELAPWLWMLPPSVFLMGVFTAMNNWNTRTRHFGRLAAAKLVNTIVSVGSQLVAGLAGMLNPGGLIGGSFVGTVVSTGGLAGAIWRDDRKQFRAAIRPAAMLDGIKRYKKFPLVSSWSALLNNISWQLPSFLLVPFFGAEVNGFFAMGNRVLRMPMSLIGAAMSQAFFPRASVAMHEGNLPVVVKATYDRLVTYTLFPMLALTFIAKDLFVFVLGAQWAEAGVYTQILSLWMFFWFVSSPMSTLFGIMDIQERGLRINLILFLSRLAALLGGALLNSPRAAMFFFSGTGVLAYGYLSFSLLALNGIPFRTTMRTIWHSFRLFIPLAIILIGLILLKAPGWIGVVIALLACGGYYIYVFVHDPEMMATLKKIKPIKKLFHL